MPRLYGNRYLACFYCGRKNSTLYDGTTRRFECPFCDATNYLDENGDITDPPVATEKEATPRQYAISRAFSPPSSPTNNPIFCPTCLKNQHLLSASLAQYLPDPDDPDYAEREKSLYRFRKNQERLYPQICAECEPRVRQRLQQAAYTAKTDLLRRMLDRSANARSSLTTQGWLGLFDAAGKWLWIAGFVLQLVWHAVVVHDLLFQYFLWAGVDDSLVTFRLLRICGPLVASLPSAERLLRWSALATILGVWWNPRFAQIVRGFTKHISGVSKWYFFQALAVGIRIFLQSVDLTTPNPLLLHIQTAGHTIAVAVALLIFSLAPAAIRINMAPLFGTTSSQPLQLHDPVEPSPSGPSSRLDETKSIADLLDEISRSPTSTTPPSPVDISPSIPQRRTNFLPMGHAHTQAAQTLTAHLQQIDHLNLSQQQQQQQQPSLNNNNYHHPPDEMDWRSSSSKHRAFNTQGQRPSQPFGSAPTEPRKGPFWYRVPPAPTTPAQRVFNPPNQPRLRASPVKFRRRRDGDVTSLTGGKDAEDGGQQQQQQVAFAEPSFFANMVVGTGGGEAGRSDPRNELSGMFGEGFKLDGEAARAREGGGGGGWLRRFARGGGGGDGKKKA
ncbi:Ima1 N-terminal domain-containing protein [Chaetomidium leptoderma]|uniref:Ima1 N-terminal domain-containing protein n=1 Tax=Chaetomidium leptoderma TaxID=669021 RepID=A0AAN7A2A1_9PEZI|nr:Ima1 N-terminal domain-containing protein [Chaetomidium leptoderma]